MKRLIVQTVKYLLFLLLGVFLLWLSFRNLSLNEIWNDILNAHYSWMFLALFFVFMAHLLRAMRWNLLIGSMGYKTRISTTFYAVMIGYMANTAVPRMGEFMRCGVLSRKEKIPFNALFGSVISERFIDLVMLAIILFSVLFFQWQLLGDFVTRMLNPFFESVGANSFALGLLAGSGLLLAALLTWLFVYFRNRFRRMPGYSKTVELIHGLLEGIRTIQKVKRKGLFIFYTVLIWLLYGLMLWAPFMMLDETSHLGLLEAITLMAIGSLGVVAPVPGGIGAYHFIGKAVLVELYSIPGTAAGSFVALTHAGQTLLHIITGGLFYFIMFFADHKKPLNE